jgi:GT2 family glycosyltransferase
MTDISLVICTRNRAAQLKRCLTRVAAVRSSANWELVVVNNDSSDVTADVISDFAKSASFPVVQTYEPVPGLGRAHNAGLSVSHGRIIAFIDDDCYPASDYVENVLKVFKDPTIGFAGGRITLYASDDYPITIKDSPAPQFFPPCSLIPAGELHGANMMFRRQAIAEIGGFDNDFGPGALFNCEDIDAFARASLAGWWGMYSPEPVVAHHHGRRARDIPALKRSYAVGRGAYLAKFTLHGASRKLFVRVWLYRVTHFAALGLRNCLQELSGAGLYICHRITSLGKGPGYR